MNATWGGIAALLLMAGVAQAEERGGLDAPDHAKALPAQGKAVIDATIKADMPGLRRCYQDRLNLDPYLAGKIVMQFRIERDGSVSEARPKSDGLPDPKVGECITARFLELTFPTSDGATIVSYPFVFNPNISEPERSAEKTKREKTTPVQDMSPEPEQAMRERAIELHQAATKERSVEKLEAAADAYAAYLSWHRSSPPGPEMGYGHGAVLLELERYPDAIEALGRAWDELPSGELRDAAATSAVDAIVAYKATDAGQADKSLFYAMIKACKRFDAPLNRAERPAACED